MADISVKPKADREGRFEVVVREGATTTTHEVTVGADTLERIGSGASAEQLLEASFRFLLDREPKESILRAFDLTTISRYFPEYEDEIGRYL